MNTGESPAGTGTALKAAGLSLSNEQKAKVPVENSENSAIINLKDDELGALNKYLGFDSYLINEALRKGGYDSLSPLQKEIVDNLDTALKKMPTYTGDLSRSLYFKNDEYVSEFVSQFIVSETITFSEYISTTCANELYNPDGQVQIFITNSKKGKDIRKFNGSESEVLYERKSTFRTIKIEYNEGKHWILLEEENEL